MPVDTRDFPKGKDPLLDVRDLSRHFELPGGGIFGPKKVLEAVSHVSFSIRRGQILGLVGESGSGKTTIGRLVMRLLDPTSGSILFDGIDLAGLSGKALRRHRKRFQMVFQDPYASLNPKMRVGEIVGEPLTIHGLASGNSDLEGKVIHLLERVGLSRHDVSRYPREFSGGGRQRIGIARAIACGPDLLVADEPIASLDLSIGSQIVNLFSSLNETEGMSMLFISHDLSVVRYLADEVVVLYRGVAVESGPTGEVFEHPAHPYSRLLLGKEKGTLEEGEREAPAFSGTNNLCRFLDRCPEAIGKCRTDPPAYWRNSSPPGPEEEGRRTVLCHLDPSGTFSAGRESREDLSQSIQGHR